MKLELVSLKLAELLKEAGFNSKVRNYICPQGQFENDSNQNWNSINTPYDHLSIPTLDLACKWLRDEHNILISIFPRFNTLDLGEDCIKGYEFRVVRTYSDLLKEAFATQCGCYFVKYEQAQETAIIEALKLIK